MKKIISIIFLIAIILTTGCNNSKILNSAKQIRDIYQGKIKNWQEGGGEDTDIIPYQREPNSGSQTLME